MTFNAFSIDCYSNVRDKLTFAWLSAWLSTTIYLNNSASKRISHTHTIQTQQGLDLDLLMLTQVKNMIFQNLAVQWTKMMT